MVAGGKIDTSSYHSASLGICSQMVGFAGNVPLAKCVSIRRNIVKLKCLSAMAADARREARHVASCKPLSSWVILSSKNSRCETW